jgi:ribonuclease PH
MILRSGLTLLVHARMIVLEACVATEQYPRTVISLSLHVINDEGSLLAACINCATLCLLDAAVALRGIVTAASCAVVAASADAEPFRDSFLLDPLTEEACTAVSLVCLAVMSPAPPLAPHFGQGGAPVALAWAKEERVVLVAAEGSTSVIGFDAALQMNIEACTSIRATIYSAIMGKISPLIPATAAN